MGERQADRDRLDEPETDGYGHISLLRTQLGVPRREYCYANRLKIFKIQMLMEKTYLTVLVSSPVSYLLEQFGPIDIPVKKYSKGPGAKMFVLLETMFYGKKIATLVKLSILDDYFHFRKNFPF